MVNRNQKQGISVTRAALLFLSVALIILGPAVARNATPTRFKLDIRPEPLDQAFLDLATQTKLSITIDPESGAGLRLSPALKGRFTLEEAFSRLIQSSDLRIVPLSANSYMVSRLQSGATTPSSEQTKAVDSSTSTDTVVVGTTIPHHKVEDSPIIRPLSLDSERLFDNLTVDELSRGIPQNFSLVNAQTSTAANVNPLAGNNVARGTAFALLGLSPDATLVLFNSHRVAPAGFDGSFVDISLLPWFVSDHVDVLLNGASAIYGSDAVTGVVNLVPLRDFQGAESTVKYGYPTSGGGTNRQVSQIAGNSWSQGGFMIGYQHSQQQSLDASSRKSLVPQPGPFEVIPSERSDHGVLTAHQTVFDRMDLSSDTYYSRRSFDQTYISNPPFLTRSNGRASLWGGGLDITTPLWTDWKSDIVGSYSREVEAVTTSANGDSQAFRTQSTVASVDVKGGGTLVEIAGHPIDMALGVSWLREGFANSVSGQGAQSVDLRRDVWGAHGELLIPFVGKDNELWWAKRVELSVAGRLDAYHNSEGEIADISSGNPKVGVLWSPLAGWNLRATYATSFRVAPLYQTEKSTDKALLLPLPNPAYPGVPYGTIYLTGGNPDLRPEFAQSYTAGMDIKPTQWPDTSFSFTWFHVDYDNRITAPPIDGDVYAIYSQVGTLRPFLNLTPSSSDIDAMYARYTVIDPYDLGSSAVRTIFDSRLQNIASTKVSGVELAASTKITTDLGQFDLRLQGQILTGLYNQAASTTPYVPVLNSEFNAPKIRLQSRAGWTKWGWSVFTSLDFTGSSRDTLLTEAGSVASWSVLDGGVAYTTADLNLPEHSKGVTIALLVNNITNKAPPPVAGLDGQTLGYDPSRASALGRTLWAMLSVRL